MASNLKSDLCSYAGVPTPSQCLTDGQSICSNEVLQVTQVIDVGLGCAPIYPSRVSPFPVLPIIDPNVCTKANLKPIFSHKFQKCMCDQVLRTAACAPTKYEDFNVLSDN